MKNTVLKYGLISGGISAALMFATVPFIYRIGFEYGHYIGYSEMLIAFLLVFFGVRAYRDNVSDGFITFQRALGVGLLITLISIFCYVVAWEIIYYTFLPDFADKYIAYETERLQKSGATAEQLTAQVETLKTMKSMLENPILTGLIAFIEPWPVGIPVSLLSALILKRKRPDELEPDAAPLPT